MANVKIWGQEELVVDKRAWKPNKHCDRCPFLFDFWCNYLEQRVPDPSYNPDCPVVEIIVEE